MTRYCPNCYNHRHSFKRAAAGFLAWYLVCKPWMAIFRYRLPPFLATAGDWLYDTRACGCRVPLVSDGEPA